jgi:UDP:flavonoid glycosyltransferase YjiC (YdhE family)
MWKANLIVPFFGDQPFWGAMVAKAGAGAHEALPYKRAYGRQAR